MSAIALLACAVFVAFLLRLEHKQDPASSRALWVPTSWLLVIMSRPLGGWLGMQGSLEAGSPVDRVFILALLGINLLILFRRDFRWPAALRDNPWLILLFAYMTVSVVWSAMPLVSLKRWTREICALTTALVVLSEEDPRQAIKSLLRRVIYILIPLSVVLIRYFPNLGCTYGFWAGERWWTGVTDQKNHLAKLCIIAIFFLVWTLWQRRRGRDAPVIRHQIYVELFLIALTLYLMGGPDHSPTYSATSTLSLAAGLAAFAGLLWAHKAGWKPGPALLAIVFGMIILYGTATPFLGKLSLFDVSSLVHRNATLTDRTGGIWGPLVPLAMQSPILGHGLGGFWTNAMRQRFLINSAHNGYLEVLLDYGFAGILFVALFIFSCARKAARTLSEDLDWGILSIAVILMALIHNITESSLSSFTSTTTALVLILATALDRSPARAGGDPGQAAGISRPDAAGLGRGSSPRIS
jgi:exopolysaccharide production protein ExoQ